MRYKFTISKETTYVLGPVNEDGTVNYVAAFNDMIGKGLGPEDNAAVLIIRALGPSFCSDPRLRQEVLQALGVDELPEQGDYFIDPASWNSPPTSQIDPLGSPAGIPPDLPEPHPFVLPPSVEESPLGKSLDAARAGPMRPADHPELVDWLSRNATPLDLVVQASRCQGYCVPWVSDSIPPAMNEYLHLSYHPVVRSPAQGLVARAMLRAGGGDFAGASSDILAVHRLARLLPPTTLLTFMGAVSVARLATDGDVGLARAKDLPPGAARNHLGAMEGLSLFPPLAASYKVGERLLILDFMMEIARYGFNEALSRAEKRMSARFVGEPPKDVELPDLELSLDDLLREFNREQDRLLACAQLPTFSQRRDAFAGLPQEDLKEVRKSAPLLPDATGFAYRKRVKALIRKVGTKDKGKMATALAQFMTHSDMVPAGRPFAIADCGAMYFEIGRVALALSACRAEKGDFPDALAALVPEYVRTLPADLFTEEPLVYRRQGNGCVVYSLGPNMKDDGGWNDLHGPCSETWSPDIPAGEGADDIVVRLE